MKRPQQMAAGMKVINLKEGMPLAQEALSRLSRELALAKQQGQRVVKLIHGYGSTGVGGEIRVAVQKSLREMCDCGQIRGYIFGENWSKSDEQGWTLLKSNPGLKHDHDLGKKNLGITIVLLQ